MEIEERVTALLEEERNMPSKDRLFDDSGEPLPKNALEQKLDAMPDDELRAISEEVCRRINHSVKFFRRFQGAEQIGFQQDQHYLNIRIQVMRLLWLYLKTAGESFDFSKIQDIQEIIFPNQQ